MALKPSDKAALHEKDAVLKFQSSHFIQCHLSLVLLQFKIAEGTIGIHPVVVRAGGETRNNIHVPLGIFLCTTFLRLHVDAALE